MREIALSSYVKALLAGDGSRSQALSIVKAANVSSAGIRLLEKSIVTTSDLNADPDFRSAGRAFIEMVKIRSLIGKINSISQFRIVPTKTRVLAQTERPAAYWTSEGGQSLATHTAFTPKVLDSKKITGLLILTKELVMGQGPAFEAAVSNDLINPIAALEGITFLEPTNTGIPGESPAAVTYGVAPVPSSGSEAVAVRTDIKALFAAFGGSLESAVLVMHPETALSLSLMQAVLGESGLTVRGGDLFGVPVVTSDSVPLDSSGAIVALIDPAGILLSDDGVDIQHSDAATVFLTGDSNGPEVLSLWQNNLVAAQARRYLNWEVARPGAVAWLSGVQWGV